MLRSCVRLVSLCALMTPCTALAVPFTVVNRSPGASTVTVSFNDGATAIFHGSSTGMTATFGAVDALAACSGTGQGELDCDLTGPAGMADIEEAINLGAYTDVIIYEDGESLPSGHEWHRLETDDNQTFIVAFDPDDLESVVDDLMEASPSSSYPCTILYDGEGKIRGCDYSGNDCECIDVVAPKPPIRERIRRWIVDHLPL